MNPSIRFSDEVLAAKAQNQPIVALESTIITHGMPHPENINTALSVCEVVRSQGVVPATIAVINGEIRVGLDNGELEQLATLANVVKASAFDLAYVQMKQLNASTTVAATSHIAAMAGLHFFATGGIGGVHKQLSEHFDISADLAILAKTPITVVASGAKSILDIPKTLEHLETLNVPVVGYQTDRFPAFYSRTSPYPIAMRVDSPEAIAKLFQHQQHLHLNQAILVANPVPEEDSIPFETLQPLIEKETAAAATKAPGKALTPYLLKRINELTEGKSLQTNIALIKNNALLAAQTAKAYFQEKILDT